MKPLRVTREMRANVYDTLELVAESVEGVGSDDFFNGDKPCCLHGMAAYGANKDDHIPSGNNPIRRELRRLGITYDENDKAVDRVRSRLGLTAGSRVPFAEVMRELSVVRVRA
jgi:hypothetical protein